jgi:hypothetical protein
MRAFREYAAAIVIAVSTPGTILMLAAVRYKVNVGIAAAVSGLIVAFMLPSLVGLLSVPGSSAFSAPVVDSVHDSADLRRSLQRFCVT